MIQLSAQPRIRLISQFIKSISRFKQFKGTTIFAFIIPSLLLLSGNTALNLNDSDLLKDFLVYLGKIGINFLMFLIVITIFPQIISKHYNISSFSIFYLCVMYFAHNVVQFLNINCLSFLSVHIVASLPLLQ